MDSMLGRITDFCSNFAVAISDVVNTDVIIIDSKMNIVGSAFRHFSLYNDIKIGSLVADVIVNNHNVIIEDKAKVKSCRECEQFKRCKMKGFIGVPVRYENRVLGAICLVIPSFKVKNLFDSKESTIKFMENMADLVAVRIMNHIEKKGLKKKISEIEKVLDMMEDAVLYTDNYGNILYMNNSFKSVFSGKDEWIGNNITNIYPQFKIYYRDQKERNDLRVSINFGNQVFYGTVSSKKIYLNEAEYGFILSFKSFKNLKENTNILLQGTYVTFEWLQGVLSRELIDEAEKAAENDDNKLITGPDNVINELIAKAVFNYSPGRIRDMKIIYMESVYRDLLDSYLFGEYGLLRNMDGGTLIVVNPENMSLYIQEKICEFIRTGRLCTEDERIVYADVKFIFCSEVNLAKLASEGKFSEELYERISGTRLEVKDTVYNNYMLFKKLVIRGIRYYCGVYHKKKFIIKRGEIKLMWQKYRSLPVSAIDRILEEAVLKDGQKSETDFENYSIDDIKPESLRELEIKRIKELMKKGYSRKKISEVLGISRTTLFRRIKEYQL